MMRASIVSLVGATVLLIGCSGYMDMKGAVKERYSKDDFNRCAPDVKMDDVCYFKFKVKDVMVETGEAVGTIPRTLVKANSKRYGIEDFDVEAYPLDLEHTFHVKPADLESLQQQKGSEVRFKSIPGSSTLEIDRSPESGDDPRKPM